MKELILDVKNIEKVVLMKVIQQDENIRGKGKVFESGNVIFLSGRLPYLKKRGEYFNVNIRGVRKDTDDLMTSYIARTTKNAEKIVHQIKQAVKEYNATLKPKIKTGYERVDVGEDYFACDPNDGQAEKFTDLRDFADCKWYNNAQYYSDIKVAQNNVRADTLMRQLRRFAVEENAKSGIVIDWKDYHQKKYYIFYNYYDNNISLSWFSEIKNLGQIYFTTKKIAQKAIDIFKDELTWYFTEYKDYYIEHKECSDECCEYCGN